jgi:hypothetical protein
VKPGRLSRRNGVAVLLGVLPSVLAVVLGLVACVRSVDGVPTAAPAAATPESAADLEALLVTAVPSGLPRLSDDRLRPPAGEKGVEDVARYSADPHRETKVLRNYGYRYGWERFWGSGGSGPVTGVFVDQFERRSGAAAYAADLAHNDAAHFRGAVRVNPPDLPGGCRLLTVEDPDPDTRLAGPAALAWCGHGAFSVSVTAVAESVEAAQEEVRAVLEEQLDRLPPH